MAGLTGLRKKIRDNLPQSWEVVLKRNQILGKFIEYVYLSLPNYMKGTGRTNSKRNTTLGLWRVKHLFKNAPIYNCFQGQYLNIDNIDWSDIWGQIKMWEEKWK